GFHAGRFAKFRMPGCAGMQLAESLDLRHGQVVTAHMKPGVQEHAAVTTRKDEDIAIDPAWFVWIVFECMSVKHGADFGAAKWQSKMARFRSFYGVHAQATRLIRRLSENFDV